jgi:excisionase family DNA binding protein
VNAIDLPPVLTIAEVATLLRVDRKTAYGMAKRGQLPGCRKVGRCLRVSRDAVLAWLGAKLPHSSEG